jgi:glycosyltransferase involved in cell wall biosynthesis
LILVQSKGLIPVVRRYCGRTQPVEYFPNWAESQFHNAALRDAPEVPPAQGQFTVMFAGNLGTSQDLPAIIAAAARLDGAASIRWVIVGDGRAAKDAQAEVARRGLAGKISFLGRFPAERMPEFFRCADALLVSLRPDPVFAMTIPGKVQSYLMSGVPLIGMIDGEGARVIVEAEAGFAGPAGDPQALAENVRRLAEMSVEDRRKMGDRGRAYALREFDRQGLIDKLDTWLVEAARTAEPV